MPDDSPKEVTPKEATAAVNGEITLGAGSGPVKGNILIALPPHLQRKPKVRAGFGTAGVILLILSIVANATAASGLLSVTWMQIVALVALVSSSLATLFAYWATPPPSKPRAPRRPKTPPPTT